MKGHPAAYGVLAAGALFYALIAVAALGIVVSADPDGRATLLIAAVLALLGGVFLALIAGMTIVPAYFIARHTGGGALLYPGWGAAIFGSGAWCLVMLDPMRSDAVTLIVLVGAAIGAMEGAIFWLAVRRSTR